MTADQRQRDIPPHEPRLFDDYRQVARLSEVVGEKEAVRIIERHFASIRTRLTSRHVAHLYDTRYFEHLCSHATAETVDGLFPLNTRQLPVFRRVCDLYPKRQERILDIGCGSGDFILALAALGYETVGVDYTPTLVSRARRQSAGHAGRFRVSPAFAVGELSKQDLPGRFDAITMNDVVEHVSSGELRTLLADCRRRLLPGGRVLIHTPNGRCFYNWTERTLKGRILHFVVHRVRGHRVEKGLEEVFYAQTHINVMGMQALRRIARSAGFHSVIGEYDDRFRIPWLSDVFSGSMTVVLC